MSSTSKILEALDLQISEVEMLSSMYPNSDEFLLDDPVTLEVIKAVVNRELEVSTLETNLGFIIQISCADQGKSLKVSLICQLPHLYPFVKPQVNIQAPDLLTRERLKFLRDDLNKEVESQEKGDIIFGVLVEWLKERLYEELPYLEKEQQKNTPAKKSQGPVKDKFSRLWIYSHHIYSKIKRKDINDWGIELSLHGFCMPGKPGIICAEGFSQDVDEFWYRIRRMNWKKICIKEQEIIPVTKDKDVSSFYKFDPFHELVLDARGGKGREYHMDLGQFKSYLDQHGSIQVFSLFFGLEGRAHEDNDEEEEKS